MSKGLYSVLLGDTAVAGMPTAIPASVWANPDVRLRVWFNDGTNGSQLLTPDQRLAPNSYLADGSVSGAALATGAVTSAKIANGAVGGAQLSTSVPLLDVNQSFTGQNTFNNPANSFTGSSFSVGNGAGLTSDQGGSLELGNSLQPGSVPFIDFHYGTGAAHDFNVRLINDGDGKLTMSGSLNVTGAITANGNLFLPFGVIQNGGTPLTTTADLGLYSQFSGNFMRFVTTAAPFHWYTDGGIGTTPSMSLTAAGNLGIGTTAADRPLSIHKTGGNGDWISFKDSNDATIWHLNNVGSGLNFAQSGIAEARLFLANNGNVGMGTTAPSAKLDVVGAIKATSATIPTLSGNVSVGGTVTTNGLAVISGGELYFNGFSGPGQIRSGDNNHRILLRNSENKMELREYGDLIFSPGATSGAETAKVVMLASGNVGIGTASPSTRLDVAGAITATSATIPTLNGNVGIGTSTPRSALEVNGDIRMSGARTKLFYEGDLNDGTQTGSMGFYTTNGGATAIMTPYDANGNTIANSMVSFGGFGAFESSVVALRTSGNISAPSATIPTLNGNVTVTGEVTANVVTVLGGSDVAEPYEVASAGEIKPVPGMVVAIDSKHVGQMRVAAHAYDKTVAGILSGANGIAPGITLRQKGTVADGSLPVASIGRVWCWCDADANGPIEAGDMLTTSDTPGHAMRVDDHNEANGAVIGKAMSKLESGKGLVLVLVSLK